MDWLYGQIVGFLGNFFAEMGGMGVELFTMPWVQSIVSFFSHLAWALYGTGLVVACFECGIQASSGKADVSGAVLCPNDQGRQLFENHGIDARYTGPHMVSPTMSARYGTGGNNTPLVTAEEVNCITANASDREPQHDGIDLDVDVEVPFAVTATDHHAIFSRQRTDVFRPDDVTSTESARQYKDATDLVLHKDLHLIRRLIPLECERLQGFPDGWTDLLGASDSARYKALGNSVAIPCVDRLMRGIAAAYRKGLRYELPQ